MAWLGVMSLSRSLGRCRPLTAARPPRSLRRFSAPPPPEDAPSPPLPAPVRSCTREVSFSPPDFDHWMIVMKYPGPNTTEDQIKQSFVDTLAQVVGSEDEARARIYSMSLKYFTGFGARISMELSDKIKELPTVDWVQSDSYVDEEKKVFGMGIQDGIASIASVQCQVGRLPTIYLGLPLGATHNKKEIWGSMLAKLQSKMCSWNNNSVEVLDIACKDEEWDRNSLRDDGDNFAENQICYIRDLKKYKLSSKTLRMRL